MAWLSLGTIALATPGGPRVAFLPGSVLAALGSAAVGIMVLLLARAGAPLAPLSLLALIGLPWLPVPVPPAFLVWAGHLRVLVWTAVAVPMLWGPVGRTWRSSGAGRWAATTAERRPALTAGVLSAVVFTCAAWIAAPSVPGGDEPHYLVIAQSLLLDGDLRIENNHRRGDYESYHPGQLPPHYIRRGRDGEIYSIHAPGIAALVAPAFALGGYRTVVLFLLAVASAGGALVWHVAWLATRDRSAAWFGWAAVTFSATQIFHTFTVYPDGVGGTLALTGVWALLRIEEEQRSGSASAVPWLLHGAALAMLPWLHSRFALLAGGLGALVLLRLAATRNPAGKAAAFLAVPAVSALAWIGYFIAIYGTPDPAAPYGSTREFSAAFIPGGLAGLLFDQRFGLLANAPVFVCALAGFGTMLRARRASDERTSGRSMRRLALELLFVVVPYLLTAASFAMWWGGWSAPARFAAVIVPVLAIPCGAAWASYRTQASRLLAAGSLGLTAFISAVLILPERGRLAFNTRETYALWLDWASPIADLGRAVPRWTRDGEPQFFTEIVVWIAALALVAVVLRVVLRSSPAWSAEAAATFAAAVCAAAGMTAVAITWRIQPDRAVSGATTAAPAQLDLLRRLAGERRGLTTVLEPPSRVGRAALIGMLRIEPGARFASTGGAGRNARPLLALPAVPAGRYRIVPEAREPVGWLMVGIGQDQFALRTEPITLPPRPIEVDFPVDVRALIVVGDEDARRSVTRLVVEPISLVPAEARLTADFARRGVRYGASTVYFLDERGFPEPEAFWVGGARRTRVVVQAEAPAAGVRFLLRNAPVPNRVRVEAGAWRATLDLAPGEEREIDVPLDARRGAGLIAFEASAGFRPSEMEPGSRDTRYLGVWVRVQNRTTPPK